MENFLEIANKIVNKETAGIIVLQNGERVPSRYLIPCPIKDGYNFTLFGRPYNNEGKSENTSYDIVRFIENTKLKKIIIRILFIFAWILHKLFISIYAIPAFIIALNGWFIYFNYAWIFGKYDNHKHINTFSDMMEDTMQDVFEFVFSWPTDLIDRFENYIYIFEL